MRGDRFRFHLIEPIKVGGVVVVPVGTRGEGEVIHAAKGGMGGKAGELIIAARYLDHGGQRLPLGYLRWGRAGQDKTNEAMLASMVFTPAALFVSGGNVEAKVGTSITAKLTADVVVTPAQSLPSKEAVQ